jgi:hypothetical protein
MEMIEFNKRVAMQYGRAYNKAVRDGLEVFQFMGNDILTKYGFYLAQNLINEGLINGELNKSLIKFY